MNIYIILGILALSISFTSVYGFPSYWDEDVIEDGEITYSIDDDVEEYEDLIINSFEAWNDKLTNIELKKVKKNADIEVMERTDKNSEPFKTKFAATHKIAEASTFSTIYDTSTIKRAEIKLILDQIDYLKYPETVIKHEIGHTLGLGHVYNSKSIMASNVGKYSNIEIDECSVKLVEEYNINRNLYDSC